MDNERKNTVFEPDSFTSEAINRASLLCHEAGGGTVLLAKGIYEITSPVELFSDTRLAGCGPETVLKKSDGVSTMTVEDADYNQRRLVVKDASRFEKGMGIIVFKTQSEDCWGTTSTKIRLTEGNTIRTEGYMERDYPESCIVTNAFPVISAIDVKNIRIENLSIDGNGDRNEYINGCRGGAVYLHKAEKCTLENVTIRDFNGDGISFQTTRHISVRNCDVSGCAGHGVHPGAGSQYSLVEGCSLHDNRDAGLFVCWRVKYGTFRNNRMNGNGDSGICIGHRDTDNIFFGNEIAFNKKAGIRFRPEKDANSSDRNRFEENDLHDNPVCLIMENRAKELVFINNRNQGAEFSKESF